MITFQNVYDKPLPEELVEAIKEHVESFDLTNKTTRENDLRSIRFALEDMIKTELLKIEIRIKKKH